MERSNFKKRPEYKKSDDYTWHSSGSRSRRRDDDRDSKLIGIEFGVDGNEYLEYTENPQLVDLYREDIGVTTVPFGYFSAVPPTKETLIKPRSSVQGGLVSSMRPLHVMILHRWRFRSLHAA
jgi:hypothetical protein